MKNTICVVILSTLALAATSALLPAGSQASETSVGARVVADYKKSKAKRPGGDCYAVTHDRVDAAVKAICGKSEALPAYSGFDEFARLWASKADPKVSWIKLPEAYRGKGAPGALASIGKADLVESKEIWAGKLEPGAVIQTWDTKKTFEGVQSGDLPEEFIGHSFLFLEYVRNAEEEITGMKIADQGTDWADPATLEQSEFGYWVGGNLKCPKK